MEMFVLQPDAKEFVVASLASIPGTALCCELLGSRAVYRLPIRAVSIPNLGFSQLTANRQLPLRCLICQPQGGKTSTAQGGSLCSCGSGCCQQPASPAGLLQDAVSLVGTKKKKKKKVFLQIRKNEPRESIVKSSMQKRPFRNAMKLNRLLGDIWEPRTTSQCLGTNRRLPVTHTQTSLQ